LETSVTVAQDAFITLHHATGTPWFVTIPLIALGLNLVSRIPLTIHARKVMRRRVLLSPILRAWERKLGKNITQNAPDVTFNTRLKILKFKFKQKSRSLYKEMKVQKWKDYTNLAVFPLWITSIEALRQLCGGPRGLIGTFIFGAKKAEEEASAAAAATAASGDAATTATATTTSAAAAAGTEPTLSAAAEALQSDTLLIIGDAARDSLMDTSLATGGCLWFPDLTAPDPLHVLPFVLSAILVANVLPRTKAGFSSLLSDEPFSTTPTPSAPNGGNNNNNNTVIPVSKWQRRFQRTFLIVACAVGPLTMDLPAALHLYWITTASTTLAANEIVNWLIPIDKKLAAERPALRMPPSLIKPVRGGLYDRPVPPAPPKPKPKQKVRTVQEKPEAQQTQAPLKKPEVQQTQTPLKKPEVQQKQTPLKNQEGEKTQTSPKTPEQKPAVSEGPAPSAPGKKASSPQKASGAVPGGSGRFAPLSSQTKKK